MRYRVYHQLHASVIIKRKVLNTLNFPLDAGRQRTNYSSTIKQTYNVQSNL